MIRLLACFMLTALHAESWSVHENPKLESPAENIELTDWTLEPGEWFKITDEKTKKTYWVHHDELLKHHITWSFKIREQGGHAQWKALESSFQKMLIQQEAEMLELKKRLNALFAEA